MSSFDASDPFDSSQAWQNVPSNSNSTWRNTSSTTAAQHNHSDDIPVAIPAAPATPLVQPSAPSLHTSSETTITKMVATSSSSSTSTSTPRSATTTTTVIAAAAAKATAVAQFEDLPPSYEAAIFKDRPQIHDNYDHLRGPVGQRGQDIKARIPLDSTPSSYYQSGGGASSGGSGSGSGSGSRSAAAQGSSTGSHSQVNPNSGARYGAISPQQTPPPLQGQVSQGREDDELHSRDVDRLLSVDRDSHPIRLHQSAHGHEINEEPETHWGVVGDGKAWMALTYLLVVLLPWSLFCFVWTLATLIIAGVTMILPPLGYVFVIATVTSWRALARVDLIISRSLVAWNVREKHPHHPAKVFVSVPSSRSSSVTPPGSGSSAWSEMEQGTSPNSHRRRQSRPRRSRNLWQKGSEHLKATVSNKHTMSTLSYFLIWKLAFALVSFIFLLVLAVLAIPFMVCLLPSVLIVSRKLASGQFRWAVFWLAEKTQPIALP